MSWWEFRGFGGDFAKVSYRVIGVVYGMSEDGVAKICRYERRNVVVAKWKKGSGA